MKTQVKIVVACCILHNFIRQWDLEDDLFWNVLNEVMEEDDLIDEENQAIEKRTMLVTIVMRTCNL